MPKLLKSFSRIFIVIAVLFFLFTGLAYAIGNPSTIAIGDAFVFRNVLVTGDQLYFMRYTVNYSPVPSEDPSTTYQMVIYDTTGAVIQFLRPINYYQENIISIYLTPSQALTWNAAYYLRIQGNPGVFPILTEGVNQRTRVLNAGDYHEQTDLGAIMISQAQILETDWGITLLTSSDKLNSTGTTYFVKAVPGLNTMVPTIFQTTTSNYNLPVVAYNQTGVAQTAQNTGSLLNAAINGTADIFGASPAGGGFFMASFLCFMLGAVVYGTTRRPDFALAIAVGALAILGLMGVGGQTFMTVLWIAFFVIFVGILLWVGRTFSL